MEPVKSAMANSEEKVTPPSQKAVSEIGAPSPTDATWAAMMIPHHRTGIEMAELAMQQAATEELQRLATKSKADQEKELPRLEQIVSAAGKTPMPPEQQVERMEKQHKHKLQSLSGLDFDRYWVNVNGGHHMAAIMMTDTAMAATASEEVKALQEELRDGQLQELATLNELREAIDAS